MTPKQQRAKIRNWNKFRLQGTISTLTNLRRDARTTEEIERLNSALVTLLHVKRDWKKGETNGQ